MRGKSVLLFIAVCVTAFSQSAPQPYSVKADKLGEALTQWKANNPRFDKCGNNMLDDLSDSAVDPSLLYCLARRWEQGQNFTYADASLLSETAWFYKNSLCKVEITLLSDAGLSDLMAALKKKFGKPAGRETTRTRNGFGVISEHVRLNWTNRVSTVELTYSNAINDRPQVTFTLNATSWNLTDRAKRSEQTRAQLDM